MDEELKKQIETIKGSKASEKEKKRLIGLHRRWASEERKLQRSSREDRLKMVCGRYINYAADIAKSLGVAIGNGGIKETRGAEALIKDLKRQAKLELTQALKKYNVLPLEG